MQTEFAPTVILPYPSQLLALVLYHFVLVMVIQYSFSAQVEHL